MGFVNFIMDLLRDPRAAIASWIAAGPLAAYGFVFLIIFIETGVVFFPFLPGDSLLFACGALSATANSRLWNIFTWFTIVAVTVLTVIMFILQALGY